MGCLKLIFGKSNRLIFFLVPLVVKMELRDHGAARRLLLRFHRAEHSTHPFLQLTPSFSLSAPMLFAMNSDRPMDSAGSMVADRPMVVFIGRRCRETGFGLLLDGARGA